ncbi:MBL fold metallo-hydrolase [Clostridiaceae bacterium UIB06]|uniref:MBL fold metallo-hydrolase n=1 Tax=Clostridium thailandense TaxID=2794346 RepID=A0A949WUF2_9CLOT|nr:MBL fold metallo-hydrolase [Clostridium thailandense]MBV7272527.1 MBL fold metallo-hydrolase [Clostridium thailandense]MCH5138071.1 MBL fold metallo-hydrolase [Clostridiaceae bacterium UIB06]
MKITILIENNKDDARDLINEHGLSLYIEKDDTRILFDTGKSDNFIKNAEKLGINLKDVDLVVLSHGHTDHGGGLLAFLKINSKAKIYMKRKVQEKYFTGFLLFKKNISISRNIFEKHSNRIEYVDSFTEIVKDIFIITDINKHYKIPDGNKYLFVKDGNRLVKDSFDHELIMVIKENEAICMFTGCSHNGTVNMIESVNSFFPHAHIRALIGGFHLVKIPAIDAIGPSKEEIDLLVDKIISKNINEVYTGHCTGEKSYKKLKYFLGDKIQYMKTGTQIQI